MIYFYNRSGDEPTSKTMHWDGEKPQLRMRSFMQLAVRWPQGESVLLTLLTCAPGGSTPAADRNYTNIVAPIYKHRARIHKLRRFSHRLELSGLDLGSACEDTAICACTCDPGRGGQEEIAHHPRLRPTPHRPPHNPSPGLQDPRELHPKQHIVNKTLLLRGCILYPGYLHRNTKWRKESLQP